LNDTPVRRGLTFADNRLAQQLFGEYDQNLALIERDLGLHIVSRGNSVELTGGEGAIERATDVLDALYKRLEKGENLDRGAVRGALKLAARGDSSLREDLGELTIRTRRRTIQPRTATQADYLRAIRANKLTFALGPAGTGKTYLAVAAAVAAMAAGEVERLVLSRPAVEAGERIGFLPGDLKEKVDPYLRPLYDALHDMLPTDLVAKQIEMETIEIAPLAFMRGRTLAHSFVILDEAQNTSPQQMMMFLTRFGEGSRMVVAGDPDQVDLPPGTISGLADAVNRLRRVEEVGVQQFTAADVIRDPLVGRIVEAYASRDSRASPATPVRSAPVANPSPRQPASFSVDIDVASSNWPERLPPVEELTEQAALAALKEAGRDLFGNYSVAIMLADDAQLADLNKRFRGRDAPTNVLAFAADEALETLEYSRSGNVRHLGDIAIAYETVSREAAEQEKTLAAHLSHMIVHGVLHLLGYDHQDRVEREEMETIERAVLAGLGVPDPYEAGTPE